MDSLLASYASSDEEEEEQQQEHVDFSSKSRSGETCKPSQTSHIVSSVPQPNSSTSLSLPQPKSLSSFPQPNPSSGFHSPPQPKSPSSSFTSLPQPKSSVFASLPPPSSSSTVSFHALASSENPQPPSNPPSSGSKPKRVVQFRPPIMLIPSNDEDDDEEEKQRKPIKEQVSSNSGSSLSSFFLSLPAPKNTLGSGSAPALGAGRRSIVETIVPTTNYKETDMENKGAGASQSRESYVGNLVDGSSTTLASESLTTVSDQPNWISDNGNYGSYENFEDNGNYGGYDVDYKNYDGMSPMASSTFAPETSGYFENVTKVPGKRGRNEMPTEIIEVKQDELMKNRPREDQVKSTGIAFGPAYQPVSTKGKPSKLHKRKHQIGSLYFDMKQKEQELAERRSRGFLTKAETQAKYGW